MGQRRQEPVRRAKAVGGRVPDIVDLIKSQHRQMDELLEQAQEEGADTKGLLQQVSDMLLPHSEAEESFVYPAIRQHDPEETAEVHDGTAEHHHIEQLMRELLSEDPDGPGYDGKLAAMVGELRHHVEEEEEDLLPVLSEKASDDERAQMGARFAQETGSSDDSRANEPREGQETSSGPTRDELYEKAKEQGIEGRSTMTKDELAKAVES
jgi:hemerythrin superfamily protein